MGLSSPVRGKWAMNHWPTRSDLKIPNKAVCNLAPAHLSGLIFHDSQYSLYVLGISSHFSFKYILLSESPASQSHSLVSSSSLLSSPKQPRPSPFPVLWLHPMHSSMKESSHYVVNYLSDVFSQLTDILTMYIISIW